MSVLRPLIGKSGWLTLRQFTAESLDQAEDYLIFAAVTDDGTALDGDVAAKLLNLPARKEPADGLVPPSDVLDAQSQSRQALIQKGISERNGRFFEAEAEKLEGWADDLKLGLEREIKELDRLINEARRAATTALSLEDKLTGQKQIKALESQRSQKRRTLFDAQDEVDRKREQLISGIEGKLQQQVAAESLFIVSWELA